MSKVRKQLSEHIEILDKNIHYFDQCINRFKSLIIKTFKKKGTVFVAGNGGSAADSQHFTAELVGRYKKNRKPYSAISLSADVGTITCIANDFGYENIFSRQLEAIGKKNDLLVAISTSGNSKNIINLLKISKKKGIFSIGLLGNKGGKSKNLCNYPIVVPSNNTARIQEMHQIIYHNVCYLIDED
tara:strand:- start:428 stop:985 length:558 start_codon:yes stop_codon:yes gene_type:complete